MKKTITLIFAVLFVTVSTFGQPKSNNPLDKLLSLQKEGQLSENDYVNVLISELFSYGNAFKYHEELMKGMYEVELTSSNMLLKIFKEMPKNDKEAKTYKDIIRYDKIVNQTANKSSFIGFKMTDINSYVDIKKVEENLMSEYSPSLSIAQFFPVQVNQKNNLFWDKNIMSGIVPSGQTRILNRQTTMSFMVTPDGQPSEMFFDPTDGTIIPDGDGQHAKLFIVDRGWKRVIYCDKDFVPISGQSRFKCYDNTNGANFQSPNSIAYGNTIQSSAYQLYIADYQASKIKVATYNNSTFTISNNPTVINTDAKPYDIGFHYGSSLVYTSDDKIWYSTDYPVGALRCITTSGAELTTVNHFIWRGTWYDINPGRIDVFTGYNPAVYYYKERGMLAYVDRAMNAVVYIRLTENGDFFSNPPEAFWVQQYPEDYVINSVKFLSNLSYASDPASVLVMGNKISDFEGCLFLSKVRFRPENNGEYIVPMLVDYLGSTKSLSTGDVNGSQITQYFYDIGNAESQIGYTDIFTSEYWNNTTGIRRIKPGVDLVGQSLSEYCRDWNTSSLYIKTTSPAWIEIATAIRTSSQYIPVALSKVNGSSGQITNGKFRALIPLGSNYFQLQLVNHPTPPMPYLFANVTLVPQDEYAALDNNQKYKKQVLVQSNYINTCTSPGGCPFVSVLDENGYELDNNILHKSEYPANIGNEITDKYLMNIPPYFNPEDSTCTFRVNELDQDISTFNRFKLIAVDHPQGTKVGITEYNEIVTYVPEYISSPCRAFIDSIDVTSQVGYDTLGLAEGYKNSEMFTTYCTQSAGLGLKKTYKNFLSSYAHRNIVDDSLAVIIDPQRLAYNPGDPVPAKDYVGTIYPFNSQSDESYPPVIFSSRQTRSGTIIPIGKDINVDSIYTDFNSNISLTYFATTTVFFGGYIENELPLVFAENNKNGNVLSNLLELDQKYDNLDPELNIVLKFKDNIAHLEKGWIRDYVLVTDGQYETAGNGILKNSKNEIPKNFKLYQNFPNPFNPKTTIDFDLPKEQLVKLKVYDISGREMAVLVNELKPAGAYRITFDGSGLASGVYFYKIETGDFVQTKRMVLIK